MPPRLGTLALALGLGIALPARPRRPARKALDHLAARQDAVAGGFAEGPGTEASYSAWAALAGTRAGEDPARWRSGLGSLRDAVAAPVQRATLGDLARTSVAAAAAGLDPRSVGGRNPVRAVLAAQDGDGSIGGSAATTAWGILGLRAGSLEPSSRAVRRAAAVVRQQRPDGGWSNRSELAGLRARHDLGRRAGALGRGSPAGHLVGAGARAHSSGPRKTATAASRRWSGERARR